MEIYVCGITVHDYCHIGHARVFIVFDVLYCHLMALGFDVNYVRNITDVDDKIIARAAENGESVNALTERYIKTIHEDEAALNVLRPTHEPCATNAFDEILDLIQHRVDTGYACTAANGDVFNSVSKFTNYGQLSGRKLDDMRAGERVAVDPNKQDPMDLQFPHHENEKAQIDELIAERIAARAEKNWERGDEIRDLLAQGGITVKDAGGKTTWRRG